jgi:hypothetical protein
LVLPRETRYPRQERRARRQTGLTVVEQLEERTLLSFSNLGYSLPDLTISGEAGPRAAWGGTLDVSVSLQNIGASSTTEPMSQAAPTDTLAPNSPYSSVSQADAPDSTVEVFLTPTPRNFAGVIKLGSFAAPPLNQNNLEQLTESFTLPARPSGFAGPGGKFYVWFLANSQNQLNEVTHVNNLSKPVAVQVASQPLPELRAIGLAVPATMQPGDTIDPVAVVENLGTADSGPVTVALVESVNKEFTLGSTIVAEETVPNIAAVSETPTKGNYKKFARQLVTPPNNVVSIDFGLQTLSTTPNKFYLGVVVDPDGLVKQLSLPKNPFQVIHVVGPPIKGFPAAEFIGTPTPNTELFPNAAGSQFVGVS